MAKPTSDDFVSLTVPDASTVLHSQQGLNEREQLEVELVQFLIRSYYSIVKRNVQDSIPKAVCLGPKLDGQTAFFYVLLDFPSSFYIHTSAFLL